MLHFYHIYNRIISYLCNLQVFVDYVWRWLLIFYCFLIKFNYKTFNIFIVPEIFFVTLYLLKIVFKY